MRTYRFGYTGLLVAIVGCSRGPARVAAPNVDPNRAAGRAMELYDTDGDAALSMDELAGCPAVLNNLSLYDQNGDGVVARDEIVERLRQLYGTRIGLTQLVSRVTYKGRPLPDATVVFEPEPYLGPAIQTAQGTTNRQGSANMGISAEHVPENLRDRDVIRCGTYKVRITHPKIDLPAKYNMNTTLGYETTLGNPFAKFALTEP